MYRPERQKNPENPVDPGLLLSSKIILIGKPYDPYNNFVILILYKLYSPFEIWHAR